MIKASPARIVAAAALAGVLAALALPVQAQVNKCTQADGSVSYQATPCGSGEQPPAERVTAAQLNAAQRAQERARARAKAASEARASGPAAHPHAPGAAAKPPLASRCRTAPSKAASGPAASSSTARPC